jgi:hypothetical protein
MRKLLFATAMTGLALGGAAKANTILQSLDTGLRLTELDGAPLDLRLFDQTQGRLTGVTFDVVGRMTANGNVNNTAHQAQTFAATEDEAFSFTDNGGPLDPLLGTLNVDPSATQRYTRVAPNVPNPFGPYDVSTTPAEITGPLTAFERPHGGTDPIDVFTLTGTTVRGGGGNVSAQINTKAEALIDVTYTYTPTVTPVPEPASLAIFGVGLVGLAVVHRRRL